jgi:hypothetical protein
MPMTACKAIFQVHAGIVPGHPIPELSKRWTYSSEDYRKDCEMAKEQETKFTALLKEAHAYALQTTDPRLVNWVTVEWIWI